MSLELTLYQQMDSSFWFNTINLEWSTVYIEGTQVMISILSLGEFSSLIPEISLQTIKSINIVLLFTSELILYVPVNNVSTMEIEDIYFFGVNTKYFISNAVKKSLFCDIFTKQDEIYLVITPKKYIFFFILYSTEHTESTT